MASLEDRLLAAGELALPPAPDLADAVVAGVGRRWRRARRLRFAAFAAAACTLAAAGAGAASPALRDLVRDLFRIGGVSIERVEALPETPLRRPPQLGDPVTLAQARRLAPFQLVTPAGLGAPDAVYHRPRTPGDMVTMRWGPAERPRLLLSQWLSHAWDFRKIVPLETRVTPVEVDGEHAGVWIDGAAHGVWYLGLDGRDRTEPFVLAGNTLVWEVGDISYRLEAGVGLDEARRLAESLR
jgi:hypothetical protein